MAEKPDVNRLKELLGLDYETFVKELGEFADDNKLIAAIEAGKKDGKMNDEKVSFKSVIIAVKKLHPMQNEIDMNQSLKFQLEGKFPQSLKDILSGEPITIKAPIITLNGKYIIDGHHRWSQVYSMNDNAKMKALNLEIDDDPIDVLKAVQMAIAATIKDVPTQDVQGTNLLDADGDTVRKFVKKHISDVTLDTLKESGEIKSADKVESADYVWSNIRQMQRTSQPVKGAPDRDFMPQTDDAETDTKSWKDLLKAGVINFKEPVLANESRQINMRYIKLFEEFSHVNEAFKFVPHNNPDLTSIKQYLDEKGFKYFTPADVDGIFELEFAVVLQINPAMQVYAKSINGVKATGENEYSFKGYDGPDYEYLENALLIIEGKNAHSSININNALDRAPIKVK